MHQNRNLPIAALAMLVAFVVLAVGQGLLSRTTADPSLGKFIWGDQGFGGLAIGATTLVAGLITVALLFRRDRSDQEQLTLARRSLDLTRTAELGTRFKAGVEMLSSKESAVALGGVYLLRDVALAAPEAYRGAVIDMLMEFSRSRTSARRQVLESSIEHYDWVNPRDAAAQHAANQSKAAEKSEREVAEAMNVIGRLLSDEHEAGSEFRPLDFEGIVLSQVTLKRANFRNQTFFGAHLIDVSFVECDLYGASFRLLDDYSLNFDCCDARAISFFGSRNVTANLHFRASDCGDMGIDAAAAVVSIDRCALDNVTLSRGDFNVRNCWIALRENFPRGAAAIHWQRLFVASEGGGEFEPAREHGPPVYWPAPSDVSYEVVDGELVGS